MLCGNILHFLYKKKKNLNPTILFYLLKYFLIRTVWKKCFVTDIGRSWIFSKENCLNTISVYFFFTGTGRKSFFKWPEKKNGRSMTSLFTCFIHRSTEDSAPVFSSVEMARVAIDRLESEIIFSRSRLHAVTAWGWVAATWLKNQSERKQFK